MPKSRYSSAYFLPIATTTQTWQGHGLEGHKQSVRLRSNKNKSRKGLNVASKLPEDQPVSIPNEVAVRDFADASCNSGATQQQSATGSVNIKQTDLITRIPTLDEQHTSEQPPVVSGAFQDGHDTVQSPKKEYGSIKLDDSKLPSPKASMSSRARNNPLHKLPAPIGAFAFPYTYLDTPPATPGSAQHHHTSTTACQVALPTPESDVFDESITVKHARKETSRRGHLRLIDDGAQSDTADSIIENPTTESPTSSFHHVLIQHDSQDETPRASPVGVAPPDLVQDTPLATSGPETAMETICVIEPIITKTVSSVVNGAQQVTTYHRRQKTSKLEQPAQLDGELVCDLAPKPVITTRQGSRARQPRSYHRTQISNDADIEDNNDDCYLVPSNNSDAPTLTPSDRCVSILSTATTHVPAPSPPPTIPSRQSSLRAMRTHAHQHTLSQSARAIRISNSSSSSSSPSLSPIRPQQEHRRNITNLSLTDSSEDAYSLTATTLRQSPETEATEFDGDNDYAEADIFTAPDCSTSLPFNQIVPPRSTSLSQQQQLPGPEHNPNNHQLARNHSSNRKYTGTRHHDYNHNRNHTSTDNSSTCTPTYKHQYWHERQHIPLNHNRRSRSITLLTPKAIHASKATASALGLGLDLGSNPENELSSLQPSGPTEAIPTSFSLDLAFDFGVALDLPSPYTYPDRPLQDPTTASMANISAAAAATQHAAQDEAQDEAALDSTPPPIPISRSKPVPRILYPAPWLVDGSDNGNDTGAGSGAGYGSEARIRAGTSGGNDVRNGSRMRMGFVKNGLRRMLGQVH